jgi:hypothetical protein
VKKALLKQQDRDSEGRFKPLAGAGGEGKTKWRLYLEVQHTDFSDGSDSFVRTLISELGPLADIQCTACDGYGHTAGKKGKRCPTAARLYAIKGSKVLGSMLTHCMKSVGYDVSKLDPAAAAR